MMASPSRLHFPSSRTNVVPELESLQANKRSGLPLRLRRRFPTRLRESGLRLTTRWSRPGQPGVEFGAILVLAGRAAHLDAVRPPIALAVESERILGTGHS